MAHQSAFEKRIIEVVEFLAETKNQHKRFAHKKDLLDALHLKLKFWSAYKKGDRNIPDNEGDIKTGKHKHIRQYLISEYDVNPAWIDKGQGPMLLNESEISLNDEKTKYSAPSPDKYESLLKEMRLKDEIIEELRSKIKLQDELISVLKTSKKPIVTPTTVH